MYRDDSDVPRERGVRDKFGRWNVSGGIFPMLIPVKATGKTYYHDGLMWKELEPQTPPEEYPYGLPCVSVKDGVEVSLVWPKPLDLHCHAFRQLPYDLRRSRATYVCDCGYRKTLDYINGVPVWKSRRFPEANRRGLIGLVHSG